MVNSSHVYFSYENNEHKRKKKELTYTLTARTPLIWNVYILWTLLSFLVRVYRYILFDEFRGCNDGFFFHQEEGIF